MRRRLAKAALLAFLAGLCCVAQAQSEKEEAETEVALPDDADGPVAATPDAWIDRTHRGLHSIIWRSAMRIDRMFGAGRMDEQAYQDQATGSITPALLWDEFRGLDQKFRFRVNVPLPHLDERYDAFIGTFSREEFVTGREQESGALPRQRAGGQIDEDETLIGIRYREPEQGGRFEADAGLRIRSPLDPFLKGGYRHQFGTSERFLVTLRETLFWQNSEKFGLTSRVDVERVVDQAWLVRLTASATISERTEGVRGYSTLTAFRGLPGRRAVGLQFFTAGEFDAAVPLGEYGARVAYRQSILRDWLVLEIRPSVTWPKDDPAGPRKASWGLGVGFEMFFGLDGFEARPATF